MNKKFLVLVSLTTLLIGCGGDPVAENQQRMQEFKNSSMVRISPIPEFAATTIAKYDVSDYRSPFLPNSVHKNIKDYKPRYVKLNPTRKKYPLEQISLENLKLHGVLSKSGKLDAMIQTPDGDLIVAKVGEYMGPNNGRITFIDQDTIVLMEAIPDDQGRYLERKVTLKKVLIPIRSKN